MTIFTPNNFDQVFAATYIVTGLLCVVVCVILNFCHYGTMPPCDRRTDGQTDRQTDERTHDDIM